MVKDLESLLSVTSKGMKKSQIRELLKLTADPEIISFAGGLPAADTFPVEELTQIINEVMAKEAHLALQYGATEGDTLLRTLLVERYRKQGFDISLENLIITTASQQALDLVSKVFIDRGDKIIVGLPSYLGGLSAFSNYGAEMIGIPIDDGGMDYNVLKSTLEEMKAKGEKPKFIYIIPDFQNPSGITMNEQRRLDIIELAKEHDVLIIEDSPYRELRFEGKDVKTLYALDNTGQVLTLGTFSKIFAPGFRIGWVIGDPKILDKIVMAKQATDLCTPPFAQRIVARYVEKGLLETNIESIKEKYREKRDVMLKAFDEYMPPQVEWTCPEGGLFLFIRLPKHLDTSEIFHDAIKEKVAYVVGNAFYCDGGGKHTMRINFSYSSKEMNVEGVKRLAKVIKKYL